MIMDDDATVTSLSPERLRVLMASSQDAQMQGSVIYLLIKRLADILISAVAMLLVAPMMVIIALAIKLNDGGPVFYHQKRVGYRGRHFTFHKLRSMRVDADQQREALLGQSDADGVAFKMRRDPRITGIGRFLRKFSIDELPQLWCVFVGTMSIVGPRPHLPKEVEEYSLDHHMRLMVKPGLLCYREVKGRSELNWDEWLDLDLQYCRERNLWTDLCIFCRAFPAVLLARGAF